MGMVQEFKAFVARGNVVDLAVGVVMGTAFGKIVNSIVSDVLMPPIGYLIQGIKFTDLKYTLPKKTVSIPDPSNPGAFVSKVLEPATINYGNFLQTTFDFVIISFCIFMLVKAINTMKRKQEEAPAKSEAAPTLTESLLMEIRDAVKSKT